MREDVEHGFANLPGVKHKVRVDQRRRAIAKLHLLQQLMVDVPPMHDALLK